MKMRHLTFILIIALLASGIEARKKKDKGNLSVNASVSIYDPPGNTSTALLFEVAARYTFTSKIVGELSLGWTQYSDNGQTVTMMPVQLNSEFHPLGQSLLIDPYAGMGVGAYITQTGEETDVSAGLQALTGVSIKAKSGISISFEVKYMLTDISDFDSGSVTFGGGIEGSWSTDL